MEHLPSVGCNHLLDAMGPEARALLEPHFEDVPFGQGQVLHEPRDDIDAVYFPHSGLVSIVAALEKSDKIIETATIGREGAVGAMAGFGPRRAFPRAVVLVAGGARRIPAPRLREAVDRSARLRDILARYSGVLLAQAQQSVACNAFHEAEERLARWLLQTRDRIDSDTIPLTQESLAQMLGVRRTTVTLIAHALQERGLLRYRRGRIEIADRDGLAAIACECYEAGRRQFDEYFPHAPRSMP